MEINLLFFVSVAPAIILYGIAKSGLGGSISLISVPLMTVVMPLNQALAIILPILIFSDIIAVCSSIAGFSSFCVHAGGTPTSLYLLPLRMKKEIYVGTRIIFFSCVNLIKLPLYVYLSMMNFDTLYQSVTLFPLALIGIFIGYKLLKIIEENLFYNIIYALILVSSAKLIIDFI